MKTILTVILIVSSVTVSAADWLSYTYESRTKSITSCGKENKSPADYMKFYDEMTVSYKVANEKRDKSNALVAITLIKNPDKASEESLNFFKSKSDCEKAFKVLSDKIEKENAAAGGANAGKYDSYK